MQVWEREPVHFADAQPAAQHQQKDGAIARCVNDLEELVNISVFRIAGQRRSDPDEVTLRHDGIRGRGVRFELEKTVEGAQGRQAPVDGTGRVIPLTTICDVAVYVVERDGLGSLVCPSKEELEIVGVEDVGQSVRTPLQEPMVKAFYFR